MVAARCCREPRTELEGEATNWQVAEVEGEVALMRLIESDEEVVGVGLSNLDGRGRQPE
jgi:hypothetical protein